MQETGALVGVPAEIMGQPVSMKMAPAMMIPISKQQLDPLASMLDESRYFQDSSSCGPRSSQSDRLRVRLCVRHVCQH